MSRLRLGVLISGRGSNLQALIDSTANPDYPATINLVICNRAGEWLTGNLLGPLVINTRTRIGQQIVLTEKKWTCRQPLVRLCDEQLVSQAA